MPVLRIETRTGRNVAIQIAWQVLDIQARYQTQQTRISGVLGEPSLAFGILRTDRPCEHVHAVSRSRRREIPFDPDRPHRSFKGTHATNCLKRRFLHHWSRLVASSALRIRRISRAMQALMHSETTKWSPLPGVAPEHFFSRTSLLRRTPCAGSKDNSPAGRCVAARRHPPRSSGISGHA